MPVNVIPGDYCPAQCLDCRYMVRREIPRCSGKNNFDAGTFEMPCRKMNPANACEKYDPLSLAGMIEKALQVAK